MFTVRYIHQIGRDLTNKKGLQQAMEPCCKPLKLRKGAGERC